MAAPHGRPARSPPRRVGSPRQRGDLSRRSGRQRHRGLLRPAERDLDLAGWPGRDGHAGARSTVSRRQFGPAPGQACREARASATSICQVGALEAAEAFYAGLLGLDVICRYPGATFLSSGAITTTSRPTSGTAAALLYAPSPRPDWRTSNSSPTGRVRGRALAPGAGAGYRSQPGAPVAARSLGHVHHPGDP